MKLAVLVAILLCVACKSKEERPREPAPGPGSAVASGSAVALDAAEAPRPAGFDACALGKTALDSARCESAQDRESLMKAKKSLDGLVDTIAQVGAGSDPTKFQVMCAQLLLAIERDAAKAKCTLSIDAAQRTEMMTMLDAWFAQRTPVAPTGDAGADAVIAKIAAVRDAACECKDGACLDRLDKQLGEVGEMPAAAPQAARDLGAKLLEDAARCANRVRTITDPPK